MKFFILTIFLLTIVTVNLLPASIVAQADPALDRLSNTLTVTGLYTATPQKPTVIIMNIIRIALGFVGLIFFIQILMSGFQWTTSAGNQEKLKKAKQKITNSVIGLAIILCAYLITVAITTYLLKAIR